MRNLLYLKRNHLYSLLLACLLVSLLASGCGSGSNDSNTARVVRVVDGDTIEVSLNGTTEKVRLIGVDTPETVHPTIGVEPYGKEASNFTKEKLTDQTVKLEFDVEERDRYGRLLAYVWLDEELFNEVLLKEGYAQLATYPPNVKYVERFKAAQKEAREAGRGLWGYVEEPQDEPKDTDCVSAKYMGNANSKKFHYPDCPSGKRTKPSNQVWFASKQEALDAGYEPCGSCNP
ncbi:MAG: thermonuclease family protein [Syntrophomonadaceae bacterium]|jgi:micrococcal nuclease|nr:thermonuclease family protein [Bacillota bacterium]HOQ10424.1 thermonuclease family protein [Syntrophomonadaceae bacterium]HPU49551.1 thermonuclease family protein [Syntrophomonadaceae bacterium]HQA08048.1 thermonuclease family protein [Syntrophomonadaceae bacterium]